MRLSFKIKAMTFLLSMGLLKASSEGSNHSDSNWLESWIIPDPGIFLWTLVTFLIVLIILKAKAWAPLIAALDKRESDIRESLNAAEKAREDAENITKDYEKMVQKAKKESVEIISASREAGEKVKTEIITEAKSNAKKIMTDNLDQIEREKNKVIGEIRQQVVELSVMAAEKIIGKTLEKDDHNKMIQDTIKEYGQT